MAQYLDLEAGEERSGRGFYDDEYADQQPLYEDISDDEDRHIAATVPVTTVQTTNANSNARPDTPPPAFRKKKNSPKKKGEFRLQARHILCTYPKAYQQTGAEHGALHNPGKGGHPQGLDAFAKAYIEQFKPDHHTICEELHEDGTIHYHVLLDMGRKMNIKNCHYFDIHGNHGKYEGARDCTNVNRYIKKTYKYVSNWDAFILESIAPGRRQKVYQDLKWSKRYLEQQERVAIKWPVKLKIEGGFEYTMGPPDPNNKKRNWWIVSTPDAGKSYWHHHLFDKQKVFLTSDGGDYMYEDYEDEDIVIADDRWPTWKEISAVTETYLNKAHVYGKARYAAVYWKYAHTRTMIVLSNKSIDQVYGELAGEHGKAQMAAMVHARFTEIRNPVFRN